MSAPRYAYVAGVERRSRRQRLAHALYLAGMAMTGAVLMPATAYVATTDIHDCPFCSWAMPAHAGDAVRGRSTRNS